jgi:multicomponent K+:H+ antiporter subunit D
MWPLNFWLAPAYSAAVAPVAALFSIMTKVGVYAMLRIWTLMFSGDVGASSGFGMDWLLVGGLATLVFGTLGLLASRQLGWLAGYSLVVSSGTLLTVLGFGQASLTGGALFYLMSSTLGVGALFLLIALIERSRLDAALEAARDEEASFAVESYFAASDPFAADTNLDEAQQALIGRVIPAAMAFLGLSFIACTLLITGMPPLSGFLGKFSMLSALLNPDGLDAREVPNFGTAAWALFALLILSGLAGLISLSRSGVRFFWSYPESRPAPRLRVVECLPIGLMVAACVLMTVRADPVMRYLQAAAHDIHSPADYIRSVLSTLPVTRAEKSGSGLPGIGSPP